MKAEVLQIEVTGLSQSKAAAEFLGSEVRPDSQAVSSFTTTTRQTRGFVDLVFVRTNISIIFWETLGVGFGAVETTQL